MGMEQQLEVPEKKQQRQQVQRRKQREVEGEVVAAGWGKGRSREVATS